MVGLERRYGHVPVIVVEAQGDGLEERLRDAVDEAQRWFGTHGG
jgi:hypothetical protein